MPRVAARVPVRRLSVTADEIFMQTWFGFRFLALSLAAVFVLAGIATGAEPTRRVLVYNKNGKGFIHDNRDAAAQAIKKLGEQNDFAVDVTEDPGAFTSENLKRYKAIIFNNTNNEIFDTEEQKVAFQQYMNGGGGFVGIHSATGSMRQWPWFWSLIGGKFARHPKMQPFTVVVKDAKDISTRHLPPSFEWTDEFYFMTEMGDDLHVLLAGDLKTLQDPEKAKSAGKHSEFYPLAWRHEFQGGRSWYTALGHKIEHYSDPRLTQHILGGILWAMGEKQPK